MMQHNYLAYPAQAYQQQQQQQNQQIAHQAFQQQHHQQQHPMMSQIQQQQHQLPLSDNNNNNGNFFKRARYDMSQQNPTTKVVSLRNIPAEITDFQIALIGLQFGDVINILYIKGKGQALIDFSGINEAVDMVHFFHHPPDNCNLKNIEAAHSSYQQLTIDTSRIQSTRNTIQSAKQIKEAAISGGDGFVIKAIITNVVYPICIDALYQVFSKYGNVLKIVLIQKNEIGALIQMKDDMQVQSAISALNGRNMYNTYTGGCNILSLQVSRHKSIEVKSNNNKSWDYTNPILTVGEPNRMDRNNDMLGHSGNMGNHKNLISDHPLLPMPMNMAAAAAAAATAAQHGHHFNPQNQNPYLTHNPHQNQHNQNNQQQGHFQSSNNISAQSVTGYPIQTMDNRPAVVQVSNFPDQIANPDALFTLFGVYGDILKVKIMYNRRDNALMQFKSYDQALNAVSKMDKVKLFDKIISVGMSKFPEIQIPIKNDGGLAKDYSTSPLHRFKKPGSKNFFNIFAPNLTLHLSNISQVTSQDQIQELFCKHGTVNNFKWISKEGNKMALIELSSLEEAVLALIDLHNFQLNGSYLRVNFAK